MTAILTICVEVLSPHKSTQMPIAQSVPIRQDEKCFIENYIKVTSQITEPKITAKRFKLRPLAMRLSS